MKINDNTILITGGGSGIGRGLAESFNALGNKVIISGRTQKRLDETTKANPGINSLSVDMTNAKSIESLAIELIEQFPKLNVVIHNAGIGHSENLLEDSVDLQDVEATIATNLLGPIRLTTALLPHLLKQPHATIITVSSGLAFVPLAMTPTYCATKAALHSYTQSLRYQLKETNITVIEIIPPYVQTELMGKDQLTDKRAIPLADFIEEVMDILQSKPKTTEINVKRVLPLRFAAEQGQTKYEKIFNGLNEAMSSH